MRKHLWCIAYTIVLLAFTVYIALDTFVISQVYVVAEDGQTNAESADRQESMQNTQSTQNTQEEAVERPGAAAPSNTPSDTPLEPGISSGSDTSAVSDTPAVSDRAYRDANISIAIAEYRAYDSTVYVADVVLSSPEYLKTAFAQNVYGKNVTAKTSEIAEENGAILAINGDYYGAQEKGFVVRNGVLYRDTASREQEDLVIYDDGTFEIVTEKETDANVLVSGGARQILSFGPALVTDGEISVTEDEEVGKAKASNPRTAVGIISDLHYLFVVSDGRTDESAGLSLYELAAFMKELGAETAYNLDGGGSSTMYFNGSVINNPTSNGKRIRERSVSDIVFIGYG